MPKCNRGVRWECVLILCTSQLAAGLAESRSHLFSHVLRVVHPVGRTIPHADDGTVRHATECSLSHISLLLFGHIVAGKVAL